MRRLSIYSFAIPMIVVLLLASPAAAALRDGWLGDVAVVAWLEEETVKVALANGGRSRVTITLSPEGWDQRWRPFFSDRTIVVPARTVVIEAFHLNSTWRGEPLAVRLNAWDRTAVVDVQTSEIFRPQAYVVRAQDEVQVFVDLGFLAAERGGAYLVVDENYWGFGEGDVGEIAVDSVEGGFFFSPVRRRVEWMDPYMVLSMRAPRAQRGVTTFTFNLYKVQERPEQRYLEEEVAGPTILVYDRSMAYQDNTHLSSPPALNRNWRR
ncbi:hypothetical protein [Candidatus Darwinibacter acetoxidans]|nr:hypothetical protein [Bacillota bacterium]